MLRIWTVADSSLRKTVDTGEDVRDLYVVGSDRWTQVVALDVRGRVRRLSLPTCEPLGVLDAPVAYSMCGGQLVDGRHVLLTGGEGLSLWDFESGRRMRIRVPQEFRRVRDVVLSTLGGRDCVTVVGERGSIVTYDLATGARISAPIAAHEGRPPDGLMRMWSDPRPHVKLAALSGTLTVPTPWRVHLWDLSTSQQEQSPIAGPVARCIVQGIRWQDRDLLLTGSSQDGVIAVWNLGVPVVRESGHNERISAVALVEGADAVVSVDEGGTIVARRCTNGRPITDPLVTGVENTRTLTAWLDGRDVIAAAGAGSRYVSDGSLRRWNITGGVQYGTPIAAHPMYVHWLSRVTLQGRQILATFGPEGQLKLWRARDGILLAETQTGVSSMVTGFVTGNVGGRVFAACSSYSQPLILQALDDLEAPSIALPEVGNDVVLSIFASHIVTGHFDEGRSGLHTIRVWNASGDSVGPKVRVRAEVTALAVRAWPSVYIGRADGRISLTDLNTGAELCPPMLLPRRPNTLNVTGGGDLIVGFGSDLARVRPPITDNLRRDSK
ncbi:WD40 repeat domain-containing protein [Spirillospora sp. NPDC048819]|uniref:WD40 repeat domain-containing protein n=1 Tax=Spirillospora sp. NPDC048819 TaxID=3155268 RepID=UPI0033EAD3EF